MERVKYYRDKTISFFEMKTCFAGMHSSRKHAHEELSIGLVEQGSSLLSCKEEDFKVDAACIVMIAPHVIHQCNPVTLEDWQFKMIYLSKDWLEPMFDLHRIYSAITVKRLDYKNLKRIQNLFELLQSNISGIEKETRLLLDLSHFFHLEDSMTAKIHLDSNHIKVMKQVRNYIHDHFLQPISLDDLAQISGLSKYYVLKLFKQAYNATPHAYQTLLRLNHAKKQLKSGETLTAVAHEVGFYDQSHFTKSFKQYFGVTPLRYISNLEKMS
ncbi:MAG: AraC family transcriptional regulator [Bacillota bacterium]